MTPTFSWVFLLALVGRAASMPQPLVVDACALICNPGAETEAERERDPVLYPRYPKVNCKLQSDSEEQQAWIITSQCLKLCNSELSLQMEANCFALRSSLGANLGCYCEAMTPLSPNTMRLHESWRLNFLVKELANDILNTLYDSPLDMLIICEIHEELLSGLINRPTGEKFQKCFAENSTRSERSVENSEEWVKVLKHSNDQDIPNVEQEKPEDVEQEKPEDIEQEKPEDVEQEKPEDVEQEEPEDVKLEEPEDVEQKKPKDVEQEKPEDIEQEKLENVEQEKLEDLVQEKPEDLKQDQEKNEAQQESDVTIVDSESKMQVKVNEESTEKNTSDDELALTRICTNCKNFCQADKKTQEKSLLVEFCNCNIIKNKCKYIEDLHFSEGK
ncbi:uncharacterized protein [Anoplolepis gracilipes]|uniref:uncharacterized protein n=1 Tax=Anoplolepis gracilipes TaxID=354296 RepID=UPI003B9DD6C8